MITLGLGLLAARSRQQRALADRRLRRLAGHQRCWPLLGLFKFDLYGYTAYSYALVALFIVFLGVRRMVNSPFGLALRGIRENWVRMPAIGADSRAHIRKAYTIAAAHRRRRRRAAGADHADRRARIAQLPALGRRAGDAGARRRRAAVWRAGRRGHLHGRARPVLRHRPAILVFLDRPAAGRRSSCSCRTASSAACRRLYRALEAQMSDALMTAIALARTAA